AQVSPPPAAVESDDRTGARRRLRVRRHVWLLSRASAARRLRGVRSQSGAGGGWTTAISRRAPVRRQRAPGRIERSVGPDRRFWIVQLSPDRQLEFHPGDVRSVCPPRADGIRGEFLVGSRGL